MLVRSSLPPNRGDRSSAHKLKEKLEMYQAGHFGGRGMSMFAEWGLGARCW